MFTFVTITYNHEAFILEHLESIKHQIEAFSDGEEIRLLIADDGSVDKTRFYIDGWLRHNGGLFCDVEIVSDGMNHGTCENAARAYEHIRTDRYKLLAGDDLYGCNNIFTFIDLLQENDVITAPTLIFQAAPDGRSCVQLAFSQYKDYIMRGLLPRCMYRAFTISGCLYEAAPTAIARRLVTHEALNFVREFKLIEDQPLSYYLFRTHAIRLKYAPEPYILYRMHAVSVSHTRNLAVARMVMADVEHLCIHYARRDRSLLYRYVAWLRLKRCRGCTATRYFSPLGYYKKLLCLHKKADMQRIYTTAIIAEAPRHEAHLAMIKERADAMRQLIEKETERNK